MIDVVLFLILIMSILLKAILEMVVRFHGFPSFSIKEQFEFTIAIFPFIPNLTYHGKKVKVINYCVAINVFLFLFLLSRIDFQ